jgi:regulator of replication initiation timing
MTHTARGSRSAKEIQFDRTTVLASVSNAYDRAAFDRLFAKLHATFESLIRREAALQTEIEMLRRRLGTNSVCEELQLTRQSQIARTPSSAAKASASQAR